MIFSVTRSLINPLRINSYRMITSHAVIYTQHGEPKDVLKTHQYTIDETNLQPDEIVVKTLGSPINPSDINQIQGVYPSKPEKTRELNTDEPAAVCGNEGLFEIVHKGSNVSNFEIGDWVVPTNVNFGTWRTFAKSTNDKFTKIPNPSQSKKNGKKNGLTINQAATISVNPPTALLMLTHYVKLQPGKDWFIQNGGNSAVGQYAIQMGKILGFNSISVVRNRDNLQELVDKLKALGANQVITEEDNNSREFSSNIKKWQQETNGEIKLALNCVGGKNSTGIARKLATNGLMLTYGGMSMQPVMIPTSLHIFKNITSSGFWVTALLNSNPDLKQKTLNQLVEWYEDELLIDAPSVQTKFDQSTDLSKVFIDAIANSKQGKQLITY